MLKFVNMIAAILPFKARIRFLRWYTRRLTTMVQQQMREYNVTAADLQAARRDSQIH